MNGRYVETTEELCLKLRQMKLSGMADAMEKQVANPNIDLMTYQERISDVINAEWDLRYTKKFNRFLKKAQLRYPEADFDQTIYDPERLLDTDTIECRLRKRADSFAERNGRGAERADTYYTNSGQ